MIPPSRHDHVGHLVYRPERVICGGRGQEWRLNEDKTGRPLGWVPTPYSAEEVA